MKTVTINGFLVGYHFSHHKEGHISWGITGHHSGTLNRETLAVIPHKFTVEVPDDLNVTALQVAGLQRERERVCKEFADSVREIDTRISKLQALEFEGVKA